jgi:hypothetical protein
MSNFPMTSFHCPMIDDQFPTIEYPMGAVVVPGCSWCMGCKWRWFHSTRAVLCAAMIAGVVLCAVPVAAQRLDMNRMWKRRVDSLTVVQGKPLHLRFHGVNTFHGIWVLNMDAQELVAQAGCRAGQLARIDGAPLPPGRYAVGHGGCWTGHSLTLHVRERRGR